MDGYNPLTQLHKISKEKDPNVFQSFVTQFENDLDIRDLRENTLLHWCCHEGRTDLCKMLIAKHVNVNAANCAGDRPLHVACKSGQDEVVDLLISHGADINLGNEYDNTPLHYACFYRFLKIIDSLIEAGAIITAVNKFSKAPLEYAGNHLYSYVVQKVKASGLNKFGGSSNSLNSAGVRSKGASRENLSLINNDIPIPANAVININKQFESLDINEEEQSVENTGSINPKPKVSHSLFQRERVIIDGVVLAAKMHLRPVSSVGLQLLREEVLVMKKMISNNLVPCLALLHGKGKVGVISPFIKCLNLVETLAKENFSLKNKVLLSMGIMRGLIYLHQKDIFHLNLKSSNILITEDLTPKLTDYGFKSSPFAESFPPQKQIIEPAWLPPELLYESYVDNLMAVDSYSFGVVINHIMSGEMPYAEYSDNPMALGFRIIYNNERPKIAPNCHPQMVPLINACWMKDALDRPTFKSTLDFLTSFLETCV